MKRLICILLFLLLFPVFSFADLPDISSLSYDELLRLRQDLNLFIWTSKEWKHVEVPTGIYVIGVDIPAGHWTIKPPAGEFVSIEYFKEVDETGRRPLDMFSNYVSESIADEKSSYASFIYNREVDFVLKDGFYLIISSGPYAIFEPYVSKPQFSFFD